MARSLGQNVHVTNFEDLSVTLEASDVEIGGVEIKNALTDDRVLVAAANATPTFGLATLPAVANAAAPTLTEAKANYLSSDLAGNLRGSIQVARGATSYANGQVTTSTSAATLVAGRATRRSVVIRNRDAVITVYIGNATVTSGNGLELRAGESVSIDAVSLIQVIAASGTPVVAYLETYD